ncbi:unnamed protein product [Ceratitis capitata]|uniref:(Mediterranean fruit fly) hypothetical protein n=1 Tax=Ceratitis capitata TaxID=7213 RepID=A0A811TWU4_CERCA|nr:unnamed protein product [Ceratitis capitata]
MSWTTTRHASTAQACNKVVQIAVPTVIKDNTAKCAMKAVVKIFYSQHWELKMAQLQNRTHNNNNNSNGNGRHLFSHNNSKPPLMSPLNCHNKAKQSTSLTRFIVRGQTCWCLARRNQPSSAHQSKVNKKSKLKSFWACCGHLTEALHSVLVGHGGVWPSTAAVKL